MKVKTLVKFRDLKESEIREIGDVFEVSKARYKEILKAGEYVEEVKKTKKK